MFLVCSDEVFDGSIKMTQGVTEWRLIKAFAGSADLQRSRSEMHLVFHRVHLLTALEFALDAHKLLGLLSVLS